MNAPDPELVYVVHRDALFGDVAPWLGVKRDGVDAIYLRADTAGRYVPRPDAETDPSLKQIIPYLVLRDGDRIFLMKRTRAGGDPRLHDRFTVGIGGHLNPGDGGVLGGHADAALHGTRVAHDVVAGDPGAAGVRYGQRGEDADGGGLARPVRTEHAQDRAGAYGQVDAGQRLRRSESLGEALGLQHVFYHVCSLFLYNSPAVG